MHTLEIFLNGKKVAQDTLSDEQVILLALIPDKDPNQLSLFDDNFAE